MTPKEKAIELVNKMNIEYKCTRLGTYITINTSKNPYSKECALILVDEILELPETQEEYQIQYTNGEWSREIGYKYSKYWLEVKKEIEKL